MTKNAHNLMHLLFHLILFVATIYSNYLFLATKGIQAIDHFEVKNHPVPFVQLSRERSYSILYESHDHS